MQESFQIKLNKLDECKYHVSCQIHDSKFINTKKDFVISQLKPNIHVPGFMRGRASKEAILFRYKNLVTDELKKSLASESVQETIYENKFKVLGQPYFSGVNLRDNIFTCDFVMFTKPSCELTQYKEFELPSPPNFDVDSETQKTLQEYRRTYGDVKVLETEQVELGDQLVIEDKVFLDGVEQEDLSSSFKMVAVINEEYENNFLGMRAGEEKPFILKSNEPNYENKDLEHRVKIHLASRVNLLSLDETLAKAMGKSSFDEVLKDANSKANKKAEDYKLSYLRDQVLARLLEVNSVTVPEWMINQEATLIAKRYNSEFAKLEDEKKNFLRTSAEKAIKLNVIFDEVREKEAEGVLADNEAIQFLRNSEEWSDDKLQELDKSGQLYQIVSQVKDDYLVAHLIKTCKVAQ